MISFNKDIIFLYHFDSRDSTLKYGKIRLSALSDNCENLLYEIKPVILDVINNSKAVWILDFDDINISIISIIDRDILCVDISDDGDNTDKYIYPVFIDVRDHNNLGYWYESTKVILIDNY